MARHTDGTSVDRGGTDVPEQPCRPVPERAARGHSHGTGENRVEEEAGSLAAAGRGAVITKSIDTEAWSSRYRNEAIDVPGRRVLVTNFIGTEQEKDLSEP